MEEKSSNEKEFSKNAVIKIARKAGIKCLSECAVNSIKNIMEKRIRDMSERMAEFYASKNGKTIDKKVVAMFLESEGIRYSIGA
jgi:histone H3/H4